MKSARWYMLGAVLYNVLLMGWQIADGRYGIAAVTTLCWLTLAWFYWRIVKLNREADSQSPRSRRGPPGSP